MAICETKIYITDRELVREIAVEQVRRGDATTTQTARALLRHAIDSLNARRYQVPAPAAVPAGAAEVGNPPTV